MSLIDDPTFIALSIIMVVCGGFLALMLYMDRRDRRKDSEDLRKAASKQADNEVVQGYRLPYDEQVDRERKAPPNWREK
jgi:hypothetical protein